jgi:prolyl-tRNA synthetase
MRVSQFFYQTLKEIPKEAQIPSHQLMFRTGMIQQLASGIYNYLPLALRSIRKIEQIIREELNKRGCQEVLMPVVQPAELWKESGRWDFYGPELLRFKDRKDNDYCLGPTHEEVITDLVRRNLRSYKQLPWNLYQIQTKFRDEVRPRFGLMRGREFIMKDGYSFDVSEEAAKKTYKLMYDAYVSIFRRCGLRFRPVDAATGNIGGNMSHEFQVLAQSGEDRIFCCSKCDYAANAEKARTRYSDGSPDAKSGKGYSEVETPGQKTIEEVSSFLKIPSERFIKSLVYNTDKGPVLLLIAGNRDVNEAKLQARLGVNSLNLSGDETVARITGTETGFAGPVNLKTKVPVVADHSVFTGTDMVCGANKKDFHLVSINPSRDFNADIRDDFSFVEPGNICPDCDGTLGEFRGIEVGQVFYLGTKYSEAMKCIFLDAEGKEKNAVMGCFGIGVGRTMASSIEQNHDDNGIIWPVSIAPFEVVVLPLQTNVPEVLAAGEKIYRDCEAAGIDVILDDRSERAGVKFIDADLIGYPYQVVIGGRSLEKGLVEMKTRKTGEKQEILLESIVSLLSDLIRKEKESYNGL